MRRFAYEGSGEVKGGKLRGMTDQSEHFFFLCPRCADNTIMQILDFEVSRDGPVKYAPEVRPKAKRDFKIAMEIHCAQCGLTDLVEISNDAWQGGKITNSPFFDAPPLYPEVSSKHK